jgi:SAM-dependent methyltransferase
MHEASFEKMRAFKCTYLQPSPAHQIRVLDVGSGSPPGSLTYRALFSSSEFRYVGLDVEPGANVDVVPADSFCWGEFDSESFDVVVSGQMLEHNPYFWITLAEVARVLAEGGLVAIIAPSTGFPHRYPLDCWRFYPDSWPSMCAYVGLELVESHREQVSWRKTIPGTYWRDAMMVARKPVFLDDESRKAFYTRLETIVSLRVDVPEAASGPSGTTAGTLYEETHTLPVDQVFWRPARLAQLVYLKFRKLQETKYAQEARRRVWSWDGRRALARGDQRMNQAETGESVAATGRRVERIEHDGG